MYNQCRFSILLSFLRCYFMKPCTWLIHFQYINFTLIIHCCRNAEVCIDYTLMIHCKCIVLNTLIIHYYTFFFRGVFLNNVYSMFMPFIINEKLMYNQCKINVLNQCIKSMYQQCIMNVQ